MNRRMLAAIVILMVAVVPVVANVVSTVSVVPNVNVFKAYSTLSNTGEVSPLDGAGGGGDPIDCPFDPA